MLSMYKWSCISHKSVSTPRSPAAIASDIGGRLRVDLHAFGPARAARDGRLGSDARLLLAGAGSHLDLLADDQAPDRLFCPRGRAAAEFVVARLEPALVLPCQL